MLSWHNAMLFFKSNVNIDYFTKVYMKAFLIGCFLTVLKMLSFIIWQNALLIKFSFSKEHFGREQFARGYRRAFFRKQKIFLTKQTKASGTPQPPLNLRLKALSLTTHRPKHHIIFNPNRLQSTTPENSKCLLLVC